MILNRYVFGYRWKKIDPVMEFQLGLSLKTLQKTCGFGILMLKINYA